MKKLALIILTVATLFSCETNKGHEHDGHEHGEHREEGHSDDEGSKHHVEDEITITSQQAKSINLKIGSLKSLKVSEVIETNGELELAPQNIADVHVLIGGVITKINVIEGSKVRKGQVLATLQHPDVIEVQEDLISQNSELNYLKQEFRRQEKLYNEKVGSGKEFQKIKAEYNGKKALVDALKAKIKMLGLNPEKVINGTITESLNITSPLNGKVSLVQTNIGEYVSTDKRLFQVVDNDHLHCAFRIYEKDILKVREGQEVIVTSPSFGNKSFIAVIYAISPAFEETPKALHVHADLKEHDDRLISGMYVSGKIETDSIKRNVLPRTAVVQEEGKKYIFIHHEVSEETQHIPEDHTEHNGEHNHIEENEHENEIHFKKVEVKTGIEEGDWIEILNTEDLSDNTEIALTSAYYLQAEMGKGETAHEH